MTTYATKKERFRRLGEYRTNEVLKRLKVLEAVYFARNLVNQPASMVNPEFLAKTAEIMSKKFENIEFRLLDKSGLKEMGMNGILTVGSGSASEPKMIVLRYNGAGEGKETVALVGKGVCFDSGGISLKPSEKMDEMKMDMAGAAAVLATFLAAVELELPVNLAAAIPLVENMPGSKSYRPGDIIKTASGKTVEVLNTDAEGRIILADALHYAASQFKPRYIVDLATLTGACVIALGHHYAGLFSDDDDLAKMLIDAGMQTGEKLWALPLDVCYKKQIESDIADLRNVGKNGKTAGTITAALFLKEFIGEHKGYAHIDIAGTAMLPEKQGYKSKGGSGFGVRLLVEFIKELGIRNQE